MCCTVLSRPKAIGCRKRSGSSTSILWLRIRNLSREKCGEIGLVFFCVCAFLTDFQNSNLACLFSKFSESLVKTIIKEIKELLFCSYAKTFYCIVTVTNRGSHLKQQLKHVPLTIWRYSIMQTEITEKHDQPGDMERRKFTQPIGKLLFEFQGKPIPFSSPSSLQLIFI